MNILTLTICLALLAFGSASQIGRRSNTDPAPPGTCIVHGLVLSPGQEGKPEGLCMRIRCGSENGADVALIEGCGTYGTDPTCKVGKPKYPKEPYPKCCEVEYDCPEGVDPTKIWGIL